MTADQFVASVRKGDAKFRLSKIILKAEGQIIRGEGLLSITGKDFQINLEVAHKYKVPQPKREIWKPTDAWKISGLIESGLKFTSDSASPQGYSQSFGKKPSFVQRLRLNRISLAPEGFDALSRARRDKILQRPPIKRAKYTDVEFHAVLFGCEPVFYNAGTDTKITNDFLGVCGGGSALDTFIDRGNAYDFALIKKEGDNLHRRGSRDSAVRLAASFFEKHTPLSKELSHLLFLFRETGSASFHTKTLALCSLFEGAVNLVFDGLKLENELRRTDPRFDEYLQLRSRLVRRLRGLAAKNKRQAYDRIAGSLGSAKEFRVQDKFKAICKHFDMPYENEMAKHYEAWNRKRNPFMHGDWKEEDSDFSDQALIAGAINIFVLKLMGFSGRMKFNAFAQETKDRYKKI